MKDAGDGLVPGTRLDGLEIERLLGAGGFGVTYLARHERLNAWRAVKEYLPRDWGTRRQDGTIGPRTGGDADDYQWGLERFLEEARILARFDHRHLVRVHDVFEARGTAYMVTEYVEGRTLAAEAAEAGPLPEARVREVLAALTDGLAEVHAAGLLHRDIKPGNVMVRPDGTPVLIDFGAARQATGRRSRSMTAVLTPGYAPIEQYSARGHQGPWTDIYALGALAYWALSGEVPEDATERVGADRVPPTAEAARGRVSARLAAAVDAAVAVDKADRPQSLEEWRGLLDERAAAGPAPERSRVGEPRQDPETSRRESAQRRWLMGAAAAGVAGAALAVGLALSWPGGVSDEERAPADEVAAIEGAPSRTAAAVAGGPGGRDSDAPGPAGNLPVTEPNPRTVEEALGLNPNDRRLIQAGLLAAGFDAGMMDGILGDRTRAALRAWQAAQGIAATSYLTAESVATLRTAIESHVTPLVCRDLETSTWDGDGIPVAFRSLEGTAGQRFNLFAAVDDPAGTAHLISPTGEVVREWDMGEVGYINLVTLPISGQYVVGLRWPNREPGATEYGLFGCPVASLQMNTPTRGTLTGEMRDAATGLFFQLWAFEGVAGQLVNAGAEADSPVSVGIVAPDGRDIPSVRTILSEVGTLPVSGHYVLIAESEHGGDYDVVVRAINVRPLTLNMPIRAVDGPGVEAWAFDGERGQRVNMSVEGDIVSPSISLYSPTGEHLNRTYRSQEPEVITLPDSGRYEVVAEGSAFEGYGYPYTVTVRTVE